jgi:hypothetical protein
MDRQSRWTQVKEFIATWRGPLSDQDGLGLDEIAEAERRLGVSLPNALREWYQLAGKRKNLISLQNRLELPAELKPIGRFLPIYSENQAVVIWGLRLDDLDLSDPPVYMYGNETNLSEVSAHDWLMENKALSEFIFQMVVFETLFAAPFSGNAPITDATVKTVEQNFERLDFPDWHWPRYPSRLFGNAKTLIEVDGNQWIWVATRDEISFSAIRRLLDIKWEYLSME